jgi:tetratricopeptide (TPR) repeat protein
VLACGALLVSLLFVYSPALRGDFIWDDDAYVTENQTLRTTAGLGRIWLEPRALPQYYPLVHTTFWAEYHLWGLNPLGYHIVNVLLHALNALLVWRLARTLGIPGAALAAAIFALHPVEVESVAWITERKNVLSGAFYFAAMLAYLRFRPLGPQSGKGRPARGFYALSLALFAAALLSKSVTASLPAALAVAVWWKRGRLQRPDLAPLVPMFAVGALSGLATVWLERHHVGAQGADWALSFIERCLIAGRALWFYAARIAWPHPLTFVYPRWQIDATAAWQYLPPAGAAAVLAALVLLRGRIGRGPLAAVLVFAGTLFPALGFFNIYPMLYSFVADHFQYLASAALMLPFAAACAAAAGRRGLRAWTTRVLAGALLAALGALTWRQAHIYRDLEVLWRDTLGKNPGAWMAYVNLGTVYTRRGEFQKAAASFTEALRLRPAEPSAHYDLGNALAKQGRLEEAIPRYREAVRLRPWFLEANYNLGLALSRLGRAAEAVGPLGAAVRLSPETPSFRHNLALALASCGRSGEAAREHSEAHRLDPDWPPPMNDLAWLLATANDPKLRNGAEAVRLAERAVALTARRDANYLDTLAAAYAETDRFAEAVETSRVAIERARSSGQEELAKEFERRFEFYLQGRPWRERAPAPPASP